MADSSLSRRAKLRVKFSGMCCTISIAGALEGMAESTSRRASVPPVEVPIATILWVVRVRLRRCTCGRVSGLSSRSGEMRAAPLIFSASSRVMSPTVYDEPGLQSTSTAPAARASIARSPPRGVRLLTTITGRGWNFISLRRKVRPSMRGISMSRVSTSGLRARIWSRAA
jgi:hypothetical protein